MMISGLYYSNRLDILVRNLNAKNKKFHYDKNTTLYYGKNKYYFDNYCIMLKNNNIKKLYLWISHQRIINMSEALKFIEEYGNYNLLSIGSEKYINPKIIIGNTIIKKQFYNYYSYMIQEYYFSNIIKL